ncbi:unnamed protein product [Closterium sp. Yama58-4]|nr:unnamed protein product [Closterium sp. Yama58-4]
MDAEVEVTVMRAVDEGTAPKPPPLSKNDRERVNNALKHFATRGWAADQALAIYIPSRFFPTAASKFRRFVLRCCRPELASALSHMGAGRDADEFLFPLFAEFCFGEFPEEIRSYRDLFCFGEFPEEIRSYRDLVFDRVNADGVYCNLVTGQERKEMPFAHHTACTIEMANLSTPVDVAVIDEIQMISDDYRGWAWTRALLGVQAAEVHVCGDPSVLPLLRAICDATGDAFECHHYHRFAPLTVDQTSLQGDLGRVSPGDCIVAFSRREIFEIKGALPPETPEGALTPVFVPSYLLPPSQRAVEMTTKHRCCVVYGALPPETRRQQARLFNEEESDFRVLVASDAIGMGLNLSIRRVIFSTLHKFNGEEKIRIPSPMVSTGVYSAHVIRCHRHVSRRQQARLFCSTRRRVTSVCSWRLMPSVWDSTCRFGGLSSQPCSSIIGNRREEFNGGQKIVIPSPMVSTGVFTTCTEAPFLSHQFRSHQFRSHQFRSHQFRSHQFRSHQFRSHQFRSHQFLSHQFRSHQFRSHQFRSHQFRSHQFRSHQFRSYQFRSHQFRSHQFRSHQFRSHQFRSHQFRSHQFRSHQFRSHQFRSHQFRSHQFLSHQFRSHQFRSHQFRSHQFRSHQFRSHQFRSHQFLSHQFLSHQFRSHQFRSHQFRSHQFRSHQFLSHQFRSHQFRSHQFRSHQFRSHQFRSHQFRSHQFRSHQFRSHQFRSHQFCSHQFRSHQFRSHQFRSHQFRSHQFRSHQFRSHQFRSHQFRSHQFRSHQFRSHQFRSHQFLSHQFRSHQFRSHQFRSHQFRSHQFRSHQFRSHQFRSHQFRSHQFLSHQFLSHQFRSHQFRSHQFRSHQFRSHQFLSHQFRSHQFRSHQFRSHQFRSHQFRSHQFRSHQFRSHQFLSHQFLSHQFRSHQFRSHQFRSHQFRSHQFLSHQFLSPQSLSPHFLSPHFLSPQFSPPPRGSRYEEGVVTCLDPTDMPLLIAALQDPVEPTTAAGLFPLFEQVEVFASQLPDVSFARLLDRFVETSKLDGTYFLCRTDNIRRVATMLDKIKGLTLRDRFAFCSAPANARDPTVMAALLRFAREYAEGNPPAGEWVRGTWRKTAASDLMALETKHQVASLYLWLSYQFPKGAFPDASLATDKAQNAAKQLSTALLEARTPNLSSSFGKPGSVRDRYGPGLTDLQQQQLCARLKKSAGRRKLGAGASQR